jgi:hypothetical protein
MYTREREREMDVLRSLNQDDPEFIQGLHDGLWTVSRFVGREFSVPFYWGSRDNPDKQRTFTLIENITIGSAREVTIPKDDYRWRIHTHIHTPGVYAPPSYRDINMTLHNAVNDVHGRRGGLSLILEQRGAWFVCGTGMLVSRVRRDEFDVDKFKCEYEKRFLNVTHGAKSPDSLCNFLQQHGFIAEFIPKIENNPDPLICPQLFQ